MAGPFMLLSMLQAEYILFFIRNHFLSSLVLDSLKLKKLLESLLVLQNFSTAQKIGRNSYVLKAFFV